MIVITYIHLFLKKETSCAASLWETAFLYNCYNCLGLLTIVKGGIVFSLKRLNANCQTLWKTQFTQFDCMSNGQFPTLSDIHVQYIYWQLTVLQHQFVTARYMLSALNLIYLFQFSRNNKDCLTPIRLQKCFFL